MLRREGREVTGANSSRWSLKNRQTRLLFYLVVLLGFAAWKFIPRPWHPTLIIETERHKIFSTATREQTDAVAHTLNLLYAAYSNRFAGVAGFETNHTWMQLKLYKDRVEMRKINPGLGWAEAFYSPPYCRAYYSAEEINPFHWMLHESVHQLNHEVTHFKLEKWLEEGLAEYFSTSQLRGNELAVGTIDLNTYPVWWIDELATSTNLTENLANGSVIPLRAIITNRGGPSMNSHFNLYYLHWWTLTHFVFESEAHRGHALKLLQRGGEAEAFEELIGPMDRIQIEWHDYVQSLKARLSGKNIKPKRLPNASTAPAPTS
ncbi:MAG: hypothetical protein QM813_10170 [Verrucomicrobiota bacterium]